MKAKRIVIKSTSGYCPGYLAYKDRLTITPNSISYERIPHFEDEDNLFNSHEKWSYKTTSYRFPLVFKEIARAVDNVIKREVLDYYTDVGTTEFIVTYENGSKVARSFELPADEFAECFKIIRELIPVTENIPEAIRLEDDCDE